MSGVPSWLKTHGLKELLAKQWILPWKMHGDFQLRKRLPEGMMSYVMYGKQITI